MTAAVAAVLLAAAPASAQMYGKAIAQPFFDFDNQARFITCRPGPYIWGFDSYLDMNGCEEVCRGGIIAHRPPSWYASADFVPMTYDPNGTIELARLGTTGPTVLTTNDLKPEFDSGARILVGRTLGNCYQVEASYLGIYSWEHDITVADSTANAGGGLGTLSTAFSDFADPAIAGLDLNSRATVSDFNTFQSAEVNIRTWLNMPPGPFDVQILAGARYMKSFEDFRFSTIADVPLPGGAQNSAIVQTQNDMYGVQLGIDMKFLINARLYVDFETKGGILDNNASQTTSYTNIDDVGTVAVFDTAAARSRTAWFGDILLTANMQVAANWSVRLGYQAIFVNGLALGPQNFQTNNSLLRTGPGQLDDTGEVIYHGPVLGVMWTR